MMRILGLWQPPSINPGDIPSERLNFERPTTPFGARFGGDLGQRPGFSLFPYDFTNADKMFRGGGGNGGGFTDTQLY